MIMSVNVKLRQPESKINYLFLKEIRAYLLIISSDHFLLSRIQLCLARPKLVYNQVTVNR